MKAIKETEALELVYEALMSSSSSGSFNIPKTVDAVAVSRGFMQAYADINRLEKVEEWFNISEDLTELMLANTFSIINFSLSDVRNIVSRGEEAFCGMKKETMLKIEYLNLIMFNSLSLIRHELPDPSFLEMFNCNLNAIRSILRVRKLYGLTYRPYDQYVIEQ